MRRTAHSISALSLSNCTKRLLQAGQSDQLIVPRTTGPEMKHQVTAFRLQVAAVEPSRPTSPLAGSHLISHVVPLSPSFPCQPMAHGAQAEGAPSPPAAPTLTCCASHLPFGPNQLLAATQAHHPPTLIRSSGTKQQENPHQKSLISLARKE